MGNLRIGDLESLPDNIRSAILLLAESRQRYLRTKIVSSSLMDAINHPNVHSSTAAKTKNALLFGDMNTYLDLPRTLGDMSTIDKSLMGITIPAEHGQNKKLTPEEKNVLEDNLKEIIHNKNRTILKIFEIIPPGKTNENELREIRELPHSLKNITQSSTTEVLKNVSDEIKEDIHLCYEELHKLYELLAALVDAEVNVIDPAESSISYSSQLQFKGVHLGSRVLLSSLEKEFYSSQGATALSLISGFQKEEIKRKKSELISLRDELASYEKLMSEGFGDLLEENSRVEKMLKEKEEFLEELSNIEREGVSVSMCEK